MVFLTLVWGAMAPATLARQAVLKEKEEKTTQCMHTMCLLDPFSLLTALLARRVSFR